MNMPGYRNALARFLMDPIGGLYGLPEQPRRGFKEDEQRLLQFLGGWRPGKATGPTRRPEGSAPPERRYDEYRGMLPPEISGAAERRKKLEDLVREQMRLEELELDTSGRGDFVELVDVDPLKRAHMNYKGLSGR